jgi:hypothetical protein
MIHLDKTDIGKISRQLDALYTAFKCFVYYTEIHKQHDSKRTNIEFWDFIEFTSLYTMLINWNEVFGIVKKNNHWKELTLEESEYINRLYQAGEYNYTSWMEYRSYISELCNDFIFFPDPYHHRDQKYNLDGIKTSLEVTHEWFHALVSDNEDLVKSGELNKWPITTKDHIGDLKQEIQTVLKAHR